MVAQSPEFLPQFTVIVDLTVENENGLAVVAEEGLRAGFEIDNLEPHRAERHVGGFIGSLLIGAPMN